MNFAVKLSLLALCLLLGSVHVGCAIHINPANQLAFFERGEAIEASPTPCGPATVSFSDGITTVCNKKKNRINITFVIAIGFGACAPIKFKKTLPCRKPEKAQKKFAFSKKCLKKRVSSCDNVPDDMKADCAKKIVEKCCKRSKITPL